MTRSIFKCAYWSFIFVKCLFRSFAQIVLLDFILLICRSSLYIVDLSLLSDVHWEYFLLVCGFFFYFPNGIF